MTTTNGSVDASEQPPPKAFPLANRLFRGYAPAAVLALVVTLVAVFVPSKASQSANASSGPGSGGASSAQSAPSSAGAGTGTAGSNTAGQNGTGATSGKVASSAGKVLPCSGQALQVPGDPYSPPCVTFSGNNSGATATGVSGNAITVTVRLTTDQSFQQTLATLAGAQLRDTNADNQRTLDALAQYFNTHFQFYGRKIVIKYFTGQGSLSNELQGYGQADAVADAKTAQSLSAFADLSAESEPYATALWHNGIVGFGDPYMPGYWHQQHSPYDWSLATDGTDLATDVANYAVQKLCPGGTPASYAGGNLKNAPRKFAGIAPQNELYQASVGVFKQIMNAHGCSIDNFEYTLDLGTESQQAANLVAKLKAGGYTTILCGCDPIFPVYLSGQAAQQNYFPEFVEIGAALVDQDYVGQLYNQQFYEHAFGISPNEATVPYTQTLGYAAYKTVRQRRAVFLRRPHLSADGHVGHRDPDGGTGPDTGQLPEGDVQLPAQVGPRRTLGLGAQPVHDPERLPRSLLESDDGLPEQPKAGGLHPDVQPRAGPPIASPRARPAAPSPRRERRHRRVQPARSVRARAVEPDVEPRPDRTPHRSGRGRLLPRMGRHGLARLGPSARPDRIHLGGGGLRIG